LFFASHYNKNDIFRYIDFFIKDAIIISELRYLKYSNGAVGSMRYIPPKNNHLLALEAERRNSYVADREQVALARDNNKKKKRSLKERVIS